jgi:hypothetical protein
LSRKEGIGFSASLKGKGQQWDMGAALPLFIGTLNRREGPMLISLLVFVLVAGLIYYLLTLLPLPDPFKKIVTVIFIIICILWLLGYAGAWGPGPYWGHPRLP